MRSNSAGRLPFAGASREEDSRRHPPPVLTRDRWRNEIEETLRRKGTREALAQCYNAVLWHILKCPHWIELTVDRLENNSLKKIAASPEHLERLASWLAGKKPGLLDEFQALRRQGDLPENGQPIFRWICRHRKDLIGFLEDRRKEFAKELEGWLEENRPGITRLFAEALELPPDKIYVKTRLLDTCCYTPCQTCLNGNAGFRKSWTA